MNAPASAPTSVGPVGDLRRADRPTAWVFPALAGLLFTFFMAASAPSPLFGVFQRAWGFSSAMLTLAFGIYALALLAALLVFGSLSDHLGRRPVVLVATALELLAMLLFVRARGIGGLLLARAVQGLATGLASGALSAAVVEAAPASQKRLGALVSSVSPLAGLAVGALLTGVMLGTVRHPVPWVFGGLALAFGLALPALVAWSEAAVRRPGAWASLRPRVAVPASVRADFKAGLPVLAVVWALGGLFLSLVPSLLRQVFGADQGWVHGAVIATLAGVGALAPPLMRGLSAKRAMGFAVGCLATGVALLQAALVQPTLAGFWVATALAGVGFGGAFSAQVQRLSQQVETRQRGELFAAIFVVSYLAFSLPAMLAGVMVPLLGLPLTAGIYLGGLLLLSLLGLWGQRQA